MGGASQIGLVWAHYAPRARAERLIATGRGVLGTFALVAAWLDSEGMASAEDALTYFLLLGYWAYALAVASVAWFLYAPPVRLGVVTHVVDLSLFAALTYLAKSPTNALFTFFLFAIAAATLRWQWRGALWTAAATLLTLNGIGLFASAVIHDPGFELDRFIMRSVYLAVMAAMLVYLGAYQDLWRREMSLLAAWPQGLGRQPEYSPRDVLESAARVVGAPRLLLAWEEREEPWLHLALWRAGELQSWREAPETFRPLVAEQLAKLTFLSADVHAQGPVVMHRGPDTGRRWRGAPIHPALESRFGMRAVLCLPLHGECLDGHLFALDKPRMTADDLLLGEVVGHQVASSIDQSLLARRLRRSAALEDRTRVSRDLHDGVLQSLTAAALQLETVQRLWDTESRAARERLAATQLLIANEQRDLRYFIRDSKLGAAGPTAAEAGLRAGLVDMAERLEWIWSVRVVLQLEGVDDEALQPLANDICLIVHEAVVNAARHAGASEVCVEVARANREVNVVVTDNGRGFPFHGEYNHVALSVLQFGPVMLKERVRSLGGTLAIRSTSAGARLGIKLPAHRGDD